MILIRSSWVCLSDKSVVRTREKYRDKSHSQIVTLLTIMRAGGVLACCCLFTQIAGSSYKQLLKKTVIEKLTDFDSFISKVVFTTEGTALCLLKQREVRLTIF